MACKNCSCPIFEQFKDYKGRWICFHTGPSIGRIICQTPIEDYDDPQAHKQHLEDAKSPKWCPMKELEEANACKTNRKNS